MAQSIKCLWHKHEDLSSSPAHNSNFVTVATLDCSLIFGRTGRARAVDQLDSWFLNSYLISDERTYLIKQGNAREDAQSRC